MGRQAIVGSLLASLLPCLLLTHVQSSFPALFIFGDSLTDPGNNNHLATLAKANRLPYGQNFTNHRPTGRFCNGPLSTDFIASLAGLPFPPPYLSAGDDILQGVSFSSATSGILNSTGDELGQHIALSEQVTFFAALKQSLVSMIGAEKASSLISKSLFYVSIGSNDYIANYFLVASRKSPLQLQYSSSAFIDLLLSNLENRILELHSMGARKFAVVSLSVIGCVPLQLLVQRSRGGQCIAVINEQARAYNSALFTVIEGLQGAYSDSRFIYLNAYDLLNDVVENPTAYGFEIADKACCGAGPYNALIPCYNRVTSVCQNVSEYVFWDLVHPTSAFNVLVANQFWSGSVPQVYPFNLQQLAAL